MLSRRRSYRTLASSDHLPDSGQTWSEMVRFGFVQSRSRLDWGLSTTLIVINGRLTRPVLSEGTDLPAGHTGGAVVVLTDYAVFHRPTVHLWVA
jgi:hypothetical protein